MIDFLSDLKQKICKKCKNYKKINKMEDEAEQVVQEEQFILRLPLEGAKKVREVLHTKPEKLKKLMKISVDLNQNKALVCLGKNRLYGSVKKLPTLIESYKTNICNNKSTIFKTADISHIIECDYEKKSKEKTETTHGICAPLKNVKKKRFRKTLFNKDFAVEAEKISKELYYLLSADLEACSSKFEIMYEGEVVVKAKKQYENILFGNLSTDTSESDNNSN